MILNIYYPSPLQLVVAFLCYGRIIGDGPAMGVMFLLLSVSILLAVFAIIREVSTSLLLSVDRAHFKFNASRAYSYRDKAITIINPVFK